MSRSPEGLELSRRLSREAKRKRKGVCVDCGAPTSYAGAPGKPVSTRCRMCARVQLGVSARGTGYRAVKILERLAEGPATTAELLTLLGLTHHQVGPTFSRLIQYGLIVRVEHGVYALPEEPQ